jgi:hypothetical protein
LYKKTRRIILLLFAYTTKPNSKGSNNTPKKLKIKNKKTKLKIVRYIQTESINKLGAATEAVNIKYL